MVDYLLREREQEEEAAAVAAAAEEYDGRRQAFAPNFDENDYDYGFDKRKRSPYWERPG